MSGFRVRLFCPRVGLVVGRLAWRLCAVPTVAVLGACTPAQTPPQSAEEPAPQEPAPSEPAVAQAPEPAPEEQTPPAEAEPPAPEKDPGPENALKLCSSICDRVAKECSERASAFCRSSCGDYESAATKCPVEVESALACQLEAEDVLLCSNIAAPSCAPLYLTLGECRQGQREPEPRVKKEEVKEPGLSGFAAVHSQLGFSQLMPIPTQTYGEQSGLLYGADAGSAHFTITEYPSPGKLSPAKILRAATAHVGNDCQPKLRLSGQFETGSVTHVKYESVCADGTQIVGMVHFMAQHTIFVEERIPGASTSPEQVVLDEAALSSFLYGFEAEL